MKTKSRWTAADIPPQDGRLIVVTGTGGLAYEAALSLAKAGAGVVLAGRNRIKGEASAQMIRDVIPDAIIRVEELDLADLASVEAFGGRMCDKNQAIDTLINNAAVMMVPRRQVTKDGFEMQFGTNHLGHFALTAHLMPLLRRGHGARVVTVCALAADSAEIDFNDPQCERRYRPMAAYGQSKLANLMFSLGLHRRSRAGRWGIESIAAHPGLSRTDLSGTRGENRDGGENKMPLPLRLLAPFLLQPADQGALPVLFAATAPYAESGSYYGPDGRGERKGFPMPAKIPSAAQNEALVDRLWATSEQLTHVCFQ
ncbi:SDR family NAD(P)-dependent oxidoreductase [Agrobacterium vitis]|uniref:SDR family NAD(P)-dependent oxidoreductase n=1 Tax=Agrobacterium vitis TaxID=373 RepID=A0A6L6VHV1_AGRVI|nr:SDR family NAD(P)-dependent oxidoreductase [Agrobacterium vitis]